MSSCAAINIENGGLAEALRAVDCRTGEGTAIAFGRLFGDHGGLMPALTVLMTLYVAIFAIGLLTGRGRVGLPALTPRLLTLGLVMTFATSWLAYQNVIWTLTTGAPDQLASIIAGTHGSASAAFADKLDTIFSAIADSAQQTPEPAAAAGAAGATSAAPQAATGAAAIGGIFTPPGMLWLSGLMLLVGTVGVLVTAKVALAALLAVGPVFIIMALFSGTRGLFEGWLKAVVSFALVPMFTVLIGGATLALISPLIQDALLDSTQVATRSVIALFLAACVYSALMAIVVKTTTTIVATWRVPFGRTSEPAPMAAPQFPLVSAAPALAGSPAAALAAERVRSMVAALPVPSGEVSAKAASTTRTRHIVTQAPASAVSVAPRGAVRRVQGVGSRFRAPHAASSRVHLS